MPGPNIRIEGIAELKKDLTDISQVAQQLDSVTQTLFSNIMRASQAVQDVVGRSATAPAPQQIITPAQYNTERGQQEAFAYSQRQAQHSAQSTSIPPLSYTPSMHNAAQFMSSTFEQAKQNVQRASGSPQAPTPQGIPQSYSATGGYSMGDLPRVLGASQDIPKKLENIAKTIEGLQKSGKKENDDMVLALQGLQRQAATSQAEFTQAMRQYKADPSAEAQQRVLAASAGVEESQRMLSDSERRGGGRDGGGVMAGRIGRGMGVAGATIAGIAGVGGQYLGTRQALDAVTYRAEVEAAEVKGRLAGEIFQRQMESAQLSPEAMLRDKGDILFKDSNFQFLGAEGRRRAKDAATMAEQTRREMQSRAQDLTIMDRVKQVGAGMAAGAGAGMLTATPFGVAAGAVGGGIAAFALGSSATRDLLSNPYAAYSGQLEGDIPEFFGSKAFDINKHFARQRERGISGHKIFTDFKSLQDAELEANRPRVETIREIQKLEMGELNLSGTVRGKHMLTSDQIMDSYIQNERLNTVAQDRAVLESDKKQAFDDARRIKRIHRIEGTTPRYRRLGRSALDTRYEGFREREDALDQEELSARDVMGDPNRLDLAELMLTGSEAQQRFAQMANVLDARPSNQTFTRAVGLGRAGLGDFGSLMQNLSGISRVSGAVGDAAQEANFTKLERVMSAAVASGFDNSRTAQNFAQSTVKLAESLGTAGVGNVAEMLEKMARAISGRPFGDVPEAAINRAVGDIQGVTEITGKTTGAMGMINAMNIINNIPSQARGLFQAMGLPKQIQMKKELEELAIHGDISKISPEALRIHRALSAGAYKPHKDSGQRKFSGIRLSPEEAREVDFGNVLPAGTRVTSPVGQRGVNEHDALDMGSVIGTGISAPLDMEIESVSREVVTESGDPSDKGNRGGNIITAISRDAEGKPLWRMGFMHLKGINVKKGQEIKKGDFFAESGNTGWIRNKDGTVRRPPPHLHYKLQKMVDGKWVVVDPESAHVDPNKTVKEMAIYTSGRARSLVNAGLNVATGMAKIKGIDRNLVRERIRTLQAQNLAAEGVFTEGITDPDELEKKRKEYLTTDQSMDFANKIGTEYALLSAAGLEVGVGELLTFSTVAELGESGLPMSEKKIREEAIKKRERETEAKNSMLKQQLRNVRSMFVPGAKDLQKPVTRADVLEYIGKTDESAIISGISGMEPDQFEDLKQAARKGSDAEFKRALEQGSLDDRMEFAARVQSKESLVEEGSTVVIGTFGGQAQIQLMNAFMSALKVNETTGGLNQGTYPGKPK